MKTTKQIRRRRTGNKSVSNEIRKKKNDQITDPIQTKLTIGQPGNKYQKETDDVARQVMLIPNPVENIQHKCKAFKEEAPLQTKPSSENIIPWIQTQQIEEEEETIQAKTKEQSLNHNKSWLQAELDSTSDNGKLLQNNTLLFMENRFGSDFKHVRIHNDSNAERLNKQLNALAFTNGSNIYFNRGKYNPESFSGKHLLAHELTHVLQQRGDSNSISNFSHTNNTIQLLTLKGFPYAKAHQMLTAIAKAKRTVNSCSRLSKVVKWLISRKLYSLTYKYDKDMDSCGWTFPLSWYVKISKNAFDKKKCCDLESTLAHEASHTILHIEKWARDLECSCFGCCS